MIYSEQLSEQSRVVAAMGLKDLIIADTLDALLVADKKYAQQARNISQQFAAKSALHATEPFKVMRPWGNYRVLQQGEGFKLKRIEVKPNVGLSLQSHQHRSEHWVVVRGQAQVVNGSQRFELLPNQSTYIPAGNRHRLTNIGSDVLVVIEVQCGACLSEDDIVRYQDSYGRSIEFER